MAAEDRMLFGLTEDELNDDGERFLYREWRGAISDADWANLNGMRQSRRLPRPPPPPAPPVTLA